MMKLFVWDLHGTLEQGNEDAATELSNRVLATFGYSERFSETLGKQLYGLKWYEYFERILPGESHEKHLALQAACFDLSNSEEGIRVISSHMQPSRNAIAVLDAIAGAHDQIVISNTTPASLPTFLEALGMSGYFARGKALAVNQHAHDAKRTKLDALEDYRRDKAYDDLIVIGDSDGDMRLAEAVKAKGYLYAHSGLAFRSNRGQYKINDLIEVLRELNSPKVRG